MPANARKEMFDSVIPGIIASLLGDATLPASGLSLITSQLYNFEAKVYMPRLVPLVYARLIPIDTSDGEGAAGRAYLIEDERGDTKEIARGSDDLPLVDISGSDKFIPFKIGGIGYTYDTEDLRQAGLLNFNRVARLPQVAFNIYERAINEHALFGNTRGGKLGFSDGLFTNSLVPVFAASGPYEGADADTLIELLLAPIDAVYNNSNNTSYANVLALPPDLMTMVERTPTGDIAGDTVLTYVKRINKTTQETGQALVVIGVRGLETANPADGPRIMAFEKLPDNLVLPLPMPLKFMTPQVRNLTFVVPGEYKYGPVHFRYPNSAVYEDFPVTVKSESEREGREIKGSGNKGELGAGKVEIGKEATGKEHHASKEAEHAGRSR